MIHNKIIGNELYVYMNGSLLYKRWLKEGYGKIIGCKIYRQPFSAKDSESFKPLTHRL